MNKAHSLKDKLSYGCGDIFAGGAFLLIGLLFLNFLTDVVKLSPFLAGSVVLVGKVWDAVSDPLMGVISDRTKSRFGRRRVYFLVGIIPIFISFSLLWYSPNSSSQMYLFAYYSLAYLFFNTIITMVMIPYNSLLPNMITDYKERTSFVTVRLMLSSVSAILSGVLPMIIIKSFGGNLRHGYLVMGALFGAFYAIPWIFVFLGTWENKYDYSKNPAKVNLYKEFAQAFRNRSFRAHAGFFVSSQTATDFLMTLFIYYLTYCLGRGKEFSLVLGVLLIVQLLSMPFHMWVSKKYGKTMPLKIGLSIWLAALFLSIFLSSKSSGIFIYLVAGLSGIGTSASVFVPWSILPEISDVDELITGRRREGIYSGMSTFIRKVAQAISVFLIGVFLKVFGYVPNVVQNARVILGIKLLFAIAPVIFITFALFFASKYKMTEKKYNILMKEVLNRRDNKAPGTDLETIAVCEELTGISYGKLSGASQFTFHI